MKSVSVIIPVYNVEKYLRECVESVLTQTSDDYEIILVDDGSTDNSGIICDEYAKKFECIKVIHKKNKGLGSSRNVGVKAAEGKYILFLDSDDYIEKETVRILINAMSESNPDICLFGGTVLYEDVEDKRIIPADTYERKYLPNEIISGDKCIKIDFERNSYITSVCLRIYRRDYFDKHFSFNEEYIHEDEDVSFLSCLKADKIRIIADKLYIRRVRKGSIMTAKSVNSSFAGYEYAFNSLMKESYSLNEERCRLCYRQAKEYMIACLNLYASSKSRDLKKRIKKECEILYKKTGDKPLLSGRISPNLYILFRKLKWKMVGVN